MNDRRKTNTARMAALFLCLALTASVLSSCTVGRSNDNTPVTESIPAPMTAEQTAETEAPFTDAFPFSFALDDGTEITTTLPCDPEYFAEMHLCALSDTESLTHVLIYNIMSDSGEPLEEVRVFSGDDGRELPVVPVNEILSRYVSITSEEDHWRMTVGGAEYQISKSQFTDVPAEQLRTEPDATRYQDFYAENGQLFCRVSFLCADTEAGIAKETLKIRMELIDGTLTAAEISFERPETEESSEP